MRATPPIVEVLSLAGCPHTEATLQMAGDVLAALAPGVKVHSARLNEREASARGFPGSPTVLVNGRDIAGKQPHAGGAS